MSEPDVFAVVCKNCSAEVSPYVTECPYCGQRVRKRAPKIGPDGSPQESRLRRRAPKLPKLRPGEIPGIAPETTPWATRLLVVLALAATVVTATNEVTDYDLGALRLPLDGDWWRLAATPFRHDNVGYAFIVLTATALFGMHLERRFGLLVPILIFVGAGAAGAAVSAAADVLPAVGANGAALGLLAAWLVDDRAATRRGDDRENDLIGVYVIAALLFALSLATEDASIVAAVTGAAIGALAGLLLTAVRR
jgi:membrane associated rhomboid family serine protease